jgi:predicted nucleic acid-binding Zn ribbon protein
MGKSLGFRVQGSGFRVQDSRFRYQGSGFSNRDHRQESRV